VINQRATAYTESGFRASFFKRAAARAIAILERPENENL
jgi:hypothetical protein